MQVADDLVAKLGRMEHYLASDPENTELLAQVIDLLLATGQAGEAEQRAREVLARLPGNPFFQARLGNTMLAQQRWQDAEQLFAELLQSHADVNLAHNLAYARTRQGNYEGALQALQPFVAQDVLPAAAAAVMVRALHHLGKLDEAIAVVQAQEQANAVDADLLGAASAVYLDADQIEQAERLSAAAAGSPRVPIEALVVAGSVALARTDAEAATGWLNKALEKNPAEGRAWSGLGTASLLRQDLVQAERQLEKAVQYLPGHIGTWHLLGWCRIFQQNLPAAEVAFNTAMDLDRNFGESHGGMAVVQALQGKRDDAEASIERAMRLDPQGLAARYAQMILSGVVADSEKFRALAKRILSSRQGAFGRNLAELVGVQGAS